MSLARRYAVSAWTMLALSKSQAPHKEKQKVTGARRRPLRDLNTGEATPGPKAEPLAQRASTEHTALQLRL